MADKKENTKDLTEELANKLLALMSTAASATVSEDKENAVYKVDIKSEDETGLLIGRRGETLIAIQTVLSMMVKEKTGEWVRIVVNVGDYREKQEDYLGSLAKQAAERAKETGEPQALYNLPADQRRLIHMALSEDPDVTTESQGEGEERYLVVKPKGK